MLATSNVHQTLVLIISILATGQLILSPNADEFKPAVRYALNELLIKASLGIVHGKLGLIDACLLVISDYLLEIK